MTLKEAAVVAECSPETIKKWCQQQRVKAKKIVYPSKRSEWDVNERSLRRFLAQPKTETRGRPRGSSKAK